MEMRDAIQRLSTLECSMSPEAICLWVYPEPAEQSCIAEKARRIRERGLLAWSRDLDAGNLARLARLAEIGREIAGEAAR